MAPGQSLKITAAWNALQYAALQHPGGTAPARSTPIWPDPDRSAILVADWHASPAAAYAERGVAPTTEEGMVVLAVARTPLFVVAAASCSRVMGSPGAGDPSRRGGGREGPDFRPGVAKKPFMLRGSDPPEATHRPFHGLTEQ